jgi:hypothetical protein
MWQIRNIHWHKKRSFLTRIMEFISNSNVSMQLLDRISSALSVAPTCPRCKGVIPSEDVNVANDIAFCRHCDLSHRLSDLTSGTPVDEDPVSAVPRQLRVPFVHGHFGLPA